MSVGGGMGGAGKVVVEKWRKLYLNNDKNNKTQQEPTGQGQGGILAELEFQAVLSNC